MYSSRDGRKLKLDVIESIHDDKLKVVIKDTIPHPSYMPGRWSPFDLGIVKTSEHFTFKKEFVLTQDEVPAFGHVLYFGAGKIRLKPKLFARQTGESRYLRLGDFLFTLGKSKTDKNENRIGVSTTLAPNDSGGPVIDKASGKVVAIATKSSLRYSKETMVPALSLSTLLGIEGNWKFIEANIR